MKQVDVDLFDPATTQNLWSELADWRRASPVVRFPTGHVYVARFSDCWRVLRDPETFPNGNGFKAVEMPDEERMLGEMDPPRHPHLRRIMRQSFDRAAVEAQRPFARETAHRLIDAWTDKPDAELVSGFTDPVSNLVSFHLLGFPLEDSDRIIGWVRDLLHSDWPALNRTERGEGLAGAFPELAAYFDGLVDARRGPDAPDDLVARLVRNRTDGKGLSPTVLRSLTAHVVLGGISTTTNLLGSMLLRILRDSGLHARLRHDPSLVAAAVEESLRVDPPVLFVMRKCSKPVEIAGSEIEAGASVLVGVASANRDETIFEDPDTYRLDRGLPRHLSFSGGAHHCIGAGLARLVAKEAITAFVERFDVGDVGLGSGYAYEGVPVFLEHGPKRLEIELANSATLKGASTVTEVDGRASKERPVFTPEQVRARRKRDLALGYRLLAAFRWGDHGDGHISARDPERTDCFWLLRYGVSFHEARVSDLVLVGPDGELVEGEGTINVAAYYIHHPILAARPDAVSATHVHTGWGTPFSAERRMLEPITQEACVFFEDHALFDDEEVQIQSVEGGKRIAAALGQNRAVVLCNHGLLTVGDSVAESVGTFVQMERVAEAHMKAPQAKPISAAAARFAKEDLVRFGAGRVPFRSMVTRHIGDPSIVE